MQVSSFILEEVSEPFRSVLEMFLLGTKVESFAHISMLDWFQNK